MFGGAKPTKTPWRRDCNSDVFSLILLFFLLFELLELCQHTNRSQNLTLKRKLVKESFY